MVETISFKLIAELSSRRVNIIRLNVACLRQRLQPRKFASPSRELATQPPQKLSEQLRGRTPSVRELQQYVSKISVKSSLAVGKSVTEPYAAFGGTEKLFEECARQADYKVPSVLEKPPKSAPKNDAGEDVGEGMGVWFQPRSEGGLELPVTFIVWAQIMYLHLYIITVRLRRFPAEHVRVWEQHLLDHFYYAAEDKMEKWHGMYARGTRNKHLKDLWLQWRGTLIAYDEGLIKGDAMLAAAVWRAIFKGDVNANIEDVAWVTAYMRKELQSADIATNNDIAAGVLKFESLSAARSNLAAQSASMSLAFKSADLQAMDELTTEKK